MIIKLWRFIYRFLAVIFLLSIVLVAVLRWVDPPVTAFMLWDRIGNDRELRHEWIPLASISRHLRITVVAAEDQKFPTHFGFDF
jgi:monofunctional glycosyltransferase